MSKGCTIFLLCLAAMAMPIAGCGDAGNPATADSAAAQFPTEPLIDPNTATAEVLAQIPELSPELIGKIVAGRPYATPTQLRDVVAEELSEEAQRELYRVLFVRINLNSAANADIRLIPSSMSARRMAHEFEEYRPYQSIAQFSSEMSKYFSAEEVAFLLRYVTLD